MVIKVTYGYSQFGLKLFKIFILRTTLELNYGTPKSIIMSNQDDDAVDHTQFFFKYVGHPTKNCMDTK